MRLRATRTGGLNTAQRLMGLLNGTLLAGEAGTFNVPANTLVRFGADTRWTYNYLSGSNPCGTSSFNGFDAAEGVAKSCIVGPFIAPGALNYVLAALFANNDQGVVIDYSDLTDEKIAWRRNSFTETEFRNGLADSPASAGNRTPAALAGFAGAMQIGYDGTTLTYLYKTNPFTPDVAYTFSAIVEMDDDLGPPVVGGASSPTGDLAINAGGIAVTNVSVSAISGRRYRIARASSGGTSIGIVKYANNTARTFKVTGYQIERGGLTAYQALTDVYSEFLAAFPYHSLYREATFSTPVIVMEDPIGGALDLRFGGARGPELVTGGDFSSAAGWATTGATAIDTGLGRAVFTAADTGAGLSQAKVTIGKTYEIIFDIVAWTAGSVRAYAGSGGIGVNVSGVGQKRIILTAAGNALLSITAIGTGVTLSIDNVSCREVYGNHALQPATGDRPVVSALINRLSNSAWTGGGSNIAPTGWGFGAMTGTAAPNGAVDGNVIYRQTAVAQRPFLQCLTTVTAAQVITISVYIDAIYSGSQTLNNALAFVLGTATAADVSYRVDGVSTPSTSMTVAGTRVSATFVTAAGGTLNLRFGAGCSGAATVDVDVSRPTLTFGSYDQSGRYQRTGAAATDYDAIGFPKGARFNGVNSWMSIANLPMSASERALLSVSLTRGSDASVGCIVELGTDSSSVNGTFGLFTPESAGVASASLRARGNGNSNRVTVSLGAAPESLILTGIIDLSAQTLALQKNGDTTAPATFPLGPTLMADAAFWIGRRGGVSLPANVLIHRIVLRGGFGDPFRLSLAKSFNNDPIKVLAQ